MAPWKINAKVFLTIASLVLGSCSLNPFGNSANITLKIPGANESSSNSLQDHFRLGPEFESQLSSTVDGFLLPSTVDGFSCWMVNVMGDAIAASNSHDNDFERRNFWDSSCAYPGILSNPISPATGGTITMSVPTGSRVVVQLIGIQKSGACPATAQQLLDNEDSDNFAAIEMARQKIQFLSQSTTVTLQNVYNSSAPVTVKCGDGGSKRDFVFAYRMTAKELVMFRRADNGNLTQVSALSLSDYVSVADIVVNPKRPTVYVGGLGLSSGKAKISSVDFDSLGFYPATLASGEFGSSTHSFSDLAVRPQGDFLFAGYKTSGISNVVEVFRIGANGALTSQSSFSLYGGSTWGNTKSLDVSANGDRIFMATTNPGTRMSYATFDPATGILTEGPNVASMSASCYSLEVPLIADPSLNEQFYAPCSQSTAGSLIETFVVSSGTPVGGNLSFITSSNASQGLVTGAAIRTNNGVLSKLYTLDSGGGSNAQVHVMDAIGSGQFSETANTSMLYGGAPGGMAINSAGTSLYISIQTGGNSHLLVAPLTPAGLPGTASQDILLESGGNQSPVAVGSLTY